MPKKYDVEFKARAVRLVRDHLDDYGSVTAASVAVGAQVPAPTVAAHDAAQLGSALRARESGTPLALPEWR